jgi:hypothetical protein
VLDRLAVALHEHVEVGEVRRHTCCQALAELAGQ